MSESPGNLLVEFCKDDTPIFHDKSAGFQEERHPFIERLIGSVRREFLDHVLFWNRLDLELKLESFQAYFNDHRVHSALGGDTPTEVNEERVSQQVTRRDFRWQTRCRGLYQLPIAA